MVETRGMSKKMRELRKRVKGKYLTQWFGDPVDLVDMTCDTLMWMQLMTVEEITDPLRSVRFYISNGLIIPAYLFDENF